jgi:hypothetical protein
LFQPTVLIHLSVGLLIVFAAAHPAARAEDPNATVVTGYVTAIHSPGEFEVNRRHVTIVASTEFGPLDGAAKNLQIERPDFSIGMYVRATGKMDYRTNTVIAAVIEIRDETEQNISGAGVIDRVFTTGPGPVFRADGYLVRVTPETDVHFGTGLTSLNEVGTNIWVRFEGKRNHSGEVLAAKAGFAKPKLPRHKRDPMAVQVGAFPPGSMIDFDGYFKTESAQHRLNDGGGWCGWYVVPQDVALQQRVRRIGMSVVPQYQRDMPDDDPAKIPFRFYAVNENTIRSEIFCDNGLVLVPLKAVERLTNDDQLAALLADGVAAELQHQGARIMLDMNLISAAEAAAYITIRSATGVGAAFGGGSILKYEIQRKMEDKRAREALGLMADAGFDPWQAPEAWRLLDPRTPKKNPSKLKYPARSTYLLGILAPQYKRATPNAAGAPGAASAQAAAPR